MAEVVREKNKWNPSINCIDEIDEMRSDRRSFVLCVSCQDFHNRTLKIQIRSYSDDEFRRSCEMISEILSFKGDFKYFGFNSRSQSDFKVV